MADAPTVLQYEAIPWDDPRRTAKPGVAPPAALVAEAGDGAAASTAPGDEEGEEESAAARQARKEEFAKKRKAFYLARDQEAAERAKLEAGDLPSPDAPQEERDEK